MTGRNPLVASMQRRLPAILEHLRGKTGAATLPPYASQDRSLLRRAITAVSVMTFLGFLFFYGAFFALTAPYLLVPMSAPLALLACVGIWALPEMRRAPTTLLEALLFAYFVCLVLWPNYLAISLPGLPWITLIRLTGFPMALTFLVCLSISREFRARLAEVLSATPYIWILVAAFAAIQLLTLPMSGTALGSVQKLVVAQVNWIAVFFISAYVFSQRGAATQWAVLLWLMTLVVCAVGILEDRAQHVLWAGHIPPFLKVEDDSVQGILSAAMRRATGEYRVKAMFTTPLGLAEFLAYAAPFILHFAMGRYSPQMRLAAALSLPLLLFVVMSTDSRLGMVGCILALLAYALYWALMRWRSDKQSLAGPAVVLAYPAAFSMVIAATFFVTRLRRKVWGGGAQEASNAGREIQVQTGIPKIISNPIGHGIGQGAETLGTVGSGGMLTIDNYHLLIILEYGVIGFFIYYGIVIASIIYSGRTALSPKLEPELTLLAPLCITMANFLVIKSVFSQQDNHPIIFMILGMIAALVYRTQATRSAITSGARLAAP